MTFDLRKMMWWERKLHPVTIPLHLGAGDELVLEDGRRIQFEKGTSFHTYDELEAFIKRVTP